MSINSFFQHRICFSIQPQLQLVNLHRNRRYFVIKLHTWFCLSYFLKINIKFYCIYRYFMSINSFFQHRICFSIQPQLQLVNLHRNRRYFVIKLHTWFCLSYFLKTNIKFYCIYQYFMSINSFFQHRICFSIQPQLQLVNLHRNRRYFVIKLHTWFCLSYFLKTNIQFYCIYPYFISINSFFNTVSVSRYSRPITVTHDPD